MLACELGDASTSLCRQRPPAGILEGGDRVEEGGLLTFGECSLECVDLQAFVVHREADDVGAETCQDLERPIVGRCLHEYARSLLHEVLGEEDEALERAAGDDDALGLNTVPLCDPRPQRRIAAAGAVRQN